MRALLKTFCCLVSAEPVFLAGATEHEKCCLGATRRVTFKWQLRSQFRKIHTICDESKFSLSTNFIKRWKFRETHTTCEESKFSLSANFIKQREFRETHTTRGESKLFVHKFCKAVENRSGGAEKGIIIPGVFSNAVVFCHVCRSQCKTLTQCSN